MALLRMISPWRLLSLIVFLFHVQAVAAKTHLHSRNAAMHDHVARSDELNNTTSSNMTLSEAHAIVSAAQAAMKITNHLICSEPQRNTYRLLNSTEREQTRKPAPSLDYAVSTTYSTSRRHVARSDENGAVSEGADSTAKPYVVPSEVAEAARIVAQSQTIALETESMTRGSELRRKWRRRANDTNVPQQAIRRADGLREYVPAESYALVTSSNVSQSEEVLAKRAKSSSFWLETLEQRGQAPFAPSGYKVNISPHKSTLCLALIAL